VFCSLKELKSCFVSNTTPIHVITFNISLNFQIIIGVVFDVRVYVVGKGENYSENFVRNLGGENI